jgi:hypothetical protein
MPLGHNHWPSIETPVSMQKFPSPIPNKVGVQISRATGCTKTLTVESDTLQHTPLRRAPVWVFEHPPVCSCDRTVVVRLRLTGSTFPQGATYIICWFH